MKKNPVTTIAIEIPGNQRCGALRQRLAVFTAAPEATEGNQFNIDEQIMSVAVIKNSDDQAVMISQPVEKSIVLIADCFNDLLARLGEDLADLDIPQLAAVEQFASHAGLFADMSLGLQSLREMIAMERARRQIDDAEGANIYRLDDWRRRL